MKSMLIGTLLCLIASPLAKADVVVTIFATYAPGGESRNFPSGASITLPIPAQGPNDPAFPSAGFIDNRVTAISALGQNQFADDVGRITLQGTSAENPPINVTVRQARHWAGIVSNVDLHLLCEINGDITSSVEVARLTELDVGGDLAAQLLADEYLPSPIDAPIQIDGSVLSSAGLTINQGSIATINVGGDFLGAFFTPAAGGGGTGSPVTTFAVTGDIGAPGSLATICSNRRIRDFSAANVHANITVFDGADLSTVTDPNLDMDSFAVNGDFTGQLEAPRVERLNVSGDCSATIRATWVLFTDLWRIGGSLTTPNVSLRKNPGQRGVAGPDHRQRQQLGRRLERRAHGRGTARLI